MKSAEALQTPKTRTGYRVQGARAMKPDPTPHPAVVKSCLAADGVEKCFVAAIFVPFTIKLGDPLWAGLYAH